MRLALVSEHASPLTAVGGEDAGGQNVHVEALARLLAARGHEVVVHTRRDDASLPDRVDAPGGYAVEHVPAGPPVALPKDDLLQYMPAFAHHLERRWSAEPVDVAHAHFWMSGIATTRAARRLGVPVALTFHALGTVKQRNQGAADTSPPERVGFERRLCRSVDRVVATCTDEVRELVAMGMPAGAASVVPCGVDTDLFRPPPPSEGRPRRLRLLAIGRLVERKGFGNVIEALTRLPGVELVIAGGPPLVDLDRDPQAVRLCGLARDLGVADRVRLDGAVDRADVPRLMGEADVVVCVPWYEPFGIVPVEAMACGRPVVGSAVGGLLDTVVPGVTGELVPPRRPDLLADVLGRLLADPARRLSYGRAGRRRARQLYPWSVVAADTEAVYAAISDRRAAAEAGR